MKRTSCEPYIMPKSSINERVLDTSIKSTFLHLNFQYDSNECAMRVRVHDRKEEKNLLERVLRRTKIKISKNSFLLQFYSEFFLTLTSLTQVCNAGTQYTCTIAMTTHTVIAHFSTMNKYFMKYIEEKMVKLN